MVFADRELAYITAVPEVKLQAIFLGKVVNLCVDVVS